MYGNGVERMGRSVKRGRVAPVRRGKSSAAGKRRSLELRAARAFKLGGRA